MIIALLLSLVVSAASAADAPAVTAAQAEQILDRVEQTGDSVISPGLDLAIKLDLPTGKADLGKTRYAARRHFTKNGDEHGFGRSKETGDYLVVVKTKEKVSYVRADKTLKFIAAASVAPGGAP